jgi:colanic acid/amylovoran biosynthesis glycosyltransferase
VTAVARRIALVSDETGDLRGLREAGWDARLVTSESCRRRGPRVGAGLALARAATHSPRAAWRSLRVPRDVTRVWCRRQLAGRLVAMRPQVIHFDSGRSAAEWLAVTDALACAVVVGVTADDLYASGSEPFAGCEAVWARAAAVHLPDRALERRALQRGLPAEVPRAVIPPPVEETFFTRAEDPDERPTGKLRIVSADALGWMQGFEHAIHAVRLLRDASVDCEYTIIGDGDYLAALTFARHQLGVVDQVQFSGPEAPRELRDRLRSADVFLGASVVDGLPQAALRALACGTPAVLADPGPLGESELDGQAALIVPRRNPEALAEKLAALAADEDLRRGMGRAARAWAAEHASSTRRRDGLESLLRQALAQ